MNYVAKEFTDENRSHLVTSGENCAQPSSYLCMNLDFTAGSISSDEAIEATTRYHKTRMTTSVIDLEWNKDCTENNRPKKL